MKPYKQKKIKVVAKAYKKNNLWKGQLILTLVIGLLILAWPKFVISAPLPIRPLNPGYDSTTHLIIAEMAAKRDEYEKALHHYLLAAEKSKEPQIARLATELAVNIQDTEKSKLASEIWTKLEPESFQAQLVAFTLHIGTDLKKAKQFIINAIELDNPELHNEMIGAYIMLSTDSQQQLSSIMKELVSQYPKNAKVHLATANIVAQQNEIELSDELNNKALKIMPTLTEAIQLKAKLIHFKEKNDKNALAYLAKKVKKYPKNMKLKMFYASALLDGDSYNLATTYLKEVSKSEKYGGRALLNLGKIYLKRGKYESAKTYFKKLDKFPEFWNNGKYFLGQIYEFENNITEAVKWYSEIYDGPHHIPSYIRAAILLTLENKFKEALEILETATPMTISDHKRIILTKTEVLVESEMFEQALNEVNRALNVIPNDIDLLYSRSLIAGFLDNINMAEEDLNTILSLDPDNAEALNALGFTLSHQPNRMKDALKHLKKALTLSPNNPTFMDSMGWLLFKMGKVDEAIEILEEAYSISKEPGIAIHLSKALWAKGKEQKAITVLKGALEANPKHKMLQATLQDLKKTD